MIRKKENLMNTYKPRLSEIINSKVINEAFDKLEISLKIYANSKLVKNNRYGFKHELCALQNKII